MKRALVLAAICLLVGVTLGCTSTPPKSLDKSKDYPLTITGSVIVPAVLEAEGIRKPAAGMVFLGLKVRMENKASKVASLGASEFNVVMDGQPYRCEPTITTVVDPRFDDQDFGTAAIQPRQSRAGWMVFETPPVIKSAINAELRFTDAALIGGGQYSRTTFDPSAAPKCVTAPERFTMEAKDVTVTYKFTDYNIEERVSAKGMLFAIADMVVTNNARVKSHFSADDLKLLTNAGNEYDVSSAAIPPDELGSKDIAAGRNAKGSILYELPDDDCDIRKMSLQYSPQEVYSYIVPRNRVETITNSPPVARIDAPEKAFINTDVSFDAVNSSDPDRDIRSYQWDFGDTKVTYDTSTSIIASYKYTKLGKYTVTLNVMDVAGLASQATRAIEVIHYFSLTSPGHGTETNGSSNHTGDAYVDVKMTNNANETRSVSYSNFQLKTLDGAILEWHGDNGKAPRTMGPGASATWRIYFVLPVEKAPAQIIYDEVLTAQL